MENEMPAADAFESAMNQALVRPAMIIIIIALLAAAFMAIVMIQSGLDKVFDYKGNLSWIKEQFSKTFMRNMIGVLLPVIMICELAAGLLCLIGGIYFFVADSTVLLAAGFALNGIVLLMLLFGQRVSKQYAGAVGLTGYFIINLIGLFMLVLLAA